MFQQLRQEQNELFFKHGYRDPLNLVFRNNIFTINSNNGTNKTFAHMLKQIDANNIHSTVLDTRMRTF